MADPGISQGHGHFFFALHIAHFSEPKEFRRLMAQVVAEQRAVPLAKGAERIYLPGEIEHYKRQERLQKGIPLDAYVVRALLEVGQELGVETGALERSL
jgi:LDH2 family malate/lactate/ureidoglycolate dehydrogenase